MLFRVNFEDHGQDFLSWVIDTQKQEVIECEPFPGFWVGKKTTQKAFQVGGEVSYINEDTEQTMKIKYPIESVDIIVQ